VAPRAPDPLRAAPLTGAMPEGDTLYRIAVGLRPFLVGRPVIAASARQPGPRTDLLIGATIQTVESQGKHLLIGFDTGLQLRTHLGMRGSWHRYAPGERWLRSPSRARLVLEVPGAVAVCFDAPTVELYETRAAVIHPVLAALGPDLLSPGFDAATLAEAVRRFRGPERAALTVAEAMLDQGVMAGVGNIYKNEVLFVERVDPFTRVADVDDETLRRLVQSSRRLLLANSEGGARVTTNAGPGERRVAGRLWVYGRAGRPCRRCGSVILDRRHGRLNRRTFWCPSCQAGVAEENR
jgi:endonuclease-8